MKSILRTALFLCLTSVLLTPTLHAQTLRDGTFFEPGSAITTRSNGAPEVLDQMQYLLGQWDVKFTTYPTDSTSVTQPAQAIITYMNRGHSFMERLFVADFDGNGHERSTISFIAFSTVFNQWSLGIADSYSEDVTMYNGDLEGKNLVLRNALRTLGNVTMAYYQATFSRQDASHFTMEIQASPDGKTAWKPILTKSYTKRTPTDGFMAGSMELGTPAPNLPKEARQFDFLTGNWSAAHSLTFPNGQTARWTANTKAGYVLNGHAVMEYHWFDTDPNLPDAATTMVRLYNRGMRRWETLYLGNRGSSILFFGGNQEGDDMVLHTFGANTAGPISHYVFHGIQPDRYSWYGETSNDRGETFNRNWIIEITRKK